MCQGNGSAANTTHAEIRSLGERAMLTFKE
ncbi:hypothetical protein FHS35_002215 [Streptomyces umbrinus]|nr:hypothetical protein [Streptomyces umbrinus]